MIDKECFLHFLLSAHKCIRAVPEKDLTNGFFVAMFERREDYTGGELVGSSNCSPNISTTKTAWKKQGRDQHNEKVCRPQNNGSVKCKQLKRTFPSNGDVNENSNNNEKEVSVKKKQKKKKTNNATEPTTPQENKFQQKVPTKKSKKNKNDQRVKNPIVAS